MVVVSDFNVCDDHRFQNEFFRNLLSLAAVFPVPSGRMSQVFQRFFLWFILMILISSCSTTFPERPSHIDLLQRHRVHTITIDGHTLAYLDGGQGTAVILLHGFGGSMWHWEHQLGPLAQTHRLLTLDLLGSGLSDKPEIMYSPARLLDTLIQFMDRVGIQQATFVGNSLGAGISIGMALTHPERVHKLVLISGLPAQLVHNIASPSYRRFVEHPPPLWLAKFGTWLAGRLATEKILKEIIFDHRLLTPLVIERSYQNRMSRGFLPPLYSILAHIPQWEESFATRLPNITHPTLVLWGTQDRIFPPAVGRQMANTIPKSTFQEVPNTGHMPQWEKPDIVNQALLHFIDDN